MMSRRVDIKQRAVCNIGLDQDNDIEGVMSIIVAFLCPSHTHTEHYYLAIAISDKCKLQENYIYFLKDSMIMRI